MENKIIRQILKILFYRRDLIKKINFHSFPIDFRKLDFDLWETRLRTKSFLDFLVDHKIVADLVDTVPKVDESGQLSEIIAHDDLDRLKMRIGLGSNSFDFDQTILSDFFDQGKVKIPIFHYAIMNHSIKCWKFLLLNGSNPLSRIQHFYFWDSRGVAAAFGETEILLNLDERGIPFDHQIFEALGLTFRNKSMIYYFKRRKEEEKTAHLIKILFKIIQSNNLKGFIFIQNRFGVDVNISDLR